MQIISQDKTNEHTQQKQTYRYGEQTAGSHKGGRVGIG